MLLDWISIQGVVRSVCCTQHEHRVNGIKNQILLFQLGNYMSKCWPVWRACSEQTFFFWNSSDDEVRFSYWFSYSCCWQNATGGTLPKHTHIVWNNVIDSYRLVSTLFYAPEKTSIRHCMQSDIPEMPLTMTFTSMMKPVRGQNMLSTNRAPETPLYRYTMPH